jgi:hypothetical protein
MWWLLLLVFIAGLYLLFRDTMNKLQYVQTLRLYWITRNNAAKGTPVVSKSFMRQTAHPWWRGSGVQFRFGRFTFHVGLLLSKGGSLLDQLDGRMLDEDTKSIRNWK